jgi:large subunit ribosomal protein L22
MKPIADLVRGKNVKDAQAILKFTPRKGAEIFLKVLNSAVANAENNHHLDVESLYVKEIYANQGPTMKRWNAGSMGRANPVLKRSSHVGVVVAERE